VLRTEELNFPYNSMLGLSDTSLGIIASVALHMGVVAAMIGPLGRGEGSDATVIVVSIDSLQQRDSVEESLKDFDTPEAPQQNKDGEVSLPLVKQKRKMRSPMTSSARKVSGSSEEAVNLEPQAVEGGGGLLTSLYSKPLLVSMPKPNYPALAREQGLEGRVELRLAINAAGSVDSAEIVKRSGVEVFDHAAQRSALQALFQPARRAGVGESSHKNVVVIFSLAE
jgi:protein TonB